MPTKEGKCKDGHPPFAGIILIRFCGYFSAIRLWRKAPRELYFYGLKRHKDIGYFLFYVTFQWLSRNSKKPIMKKIFSLLFFIGSASSFAQNKTIINDKNVEPRSVKGFHAIRVSDGIDLYLSYGDEAAAVSASETRYRDRIRTQVDNGVLRIWYDNDNLNQIIFTNRRNLRAYVSYKELDAITASAGSDVLVDGTIKGNSLK